MCLPRAASKNSSQCVAPLSFHLRSACAACACSASLLLWIEITWHLETCCACDYWVPGGVQASPCNCKPHP